MKGYRKPSGVYIEVGDTNPVGEHLVEVALRPSPDHVFTDTWNLSPMDPSLCWRVKTAAEQNATRDNELQLFLDSAGGKVVKSIVRLGIDKGLWTLDEVKLKYRTL